MLAGKWWRESCLDLIEKKIIEKGQKKSVSGTFYSLLLKTVVSDIGLVGSVTEQSE